MKKSISITVTSGEPFKIIRPGEEKYSNIQNFRFSSKIQAIKQLKKHFNIDLTYQHLKQKGIVKIDDYQIHVK